MKTTFPCVAAAALAAAAVCAMLALTMFAGIAYAEEGAETIQNEADTLAVGGVGGVQDGGVEHYYGQDGSNAISDLLNADEGMDGKVVMVAGEVVGEPIIADDSHSWVTISQDGSAISVYMDGQDAGRVQHFGKYGEIGDIVKVVGTFHVDCVEHVGDIDVHASSVEVTSGGSAAVHEIDSFKLYMAIGVLSSGLILGVAYWRLTERQR